MSSSFRTRRPISSPRYGRDQEGGEGTSNARRGAREQGWNTDSPDGSVSVEDIKSFLQDKLDPDDFDQLEQMMEALADSDDQDDQDDGDDTDYGNMIEEDEEGPPFYGQYGESSRKPLDTGNAADRRRFNRRFPGAGDIALDDNFGVQAVSRSRAVTSRDQAGFFSRFPDAARIK